MNHREMIEKLPQLVAGRLSPEETSRLERHVAECSDCGEWLDTYHLLAGATGGSAAGAAGSHPSSSELALWAVEGEPGDAATADHLAVCGSCRRELQLTRRALAAGRHRTGLRAAAARVRGLGTGGRVALAASLLLAVLAGVLLSPSRPGTAEYDLSGRNLAGRQVISVPGSLLAAAVEIESGSDVRLQAGDRIALGDGFVVRSGATLAVETTSHRDDESDES